MGWIFGGGWEEDKGPDVWKINYVFDDTSERDLFFENNPNLLLEDVLIIIKDTTPPPTLGVRNYDFSKGYNSQYKLTAL